MIGKGGVSHFDGGFGMVEEHFVPDALAQGVLLEVFVLEVEFEGGGGGGLDGRVVEHGQVRVLEGFVHRDALAGVED